MKALVINCSYEQGKRTAGSLTGYNLGAAKLANWLRSEGHEVTEWEGDPGMFAVGYDLVCLSVIFSWHAPIARDIALRVKANSEVWCGGPGIYALAVSENNWWAKETGLEAKLGIDERFDKQPGTYRATFASRGCPVGCWFCIVPRYEGRTFTLDWDFEPAPILCDNNLAALPDDFQEHIVRRYAERGVPLQDANSGFEPKRFTEETYHRWKGTLRGPWRFALDEMKELDDVRTMLRILQDVPASRKRVYVLVGNEPFEQCYLRAQKVIEWGGEPYCQPVMNLNALRKDDLRVRFDWTKQGLKDFARYYNRYLWRSMPLSEYRPRKHEPTPFAEPAP